MDYTLLIMGIFFFVAGIALRYWINRRKFNRRNVAGLEGFTSYEKATFTRFLEGIGKLIAYACILFGFICLLMYWQDKKRMEKKTESVKAVKADK